MILRRVMPVVRPPRRSTWKAWIIVTWRTVMPRGHNLSETSWRKRHRSLVILLCLMLAGTVPFGSGAQMAQVWFMILPACLAICAAQLVRGREMQSVLVTCGLFGCAATYVSLAGGVTEAHFLYFVLIGVISLYQDWRPLLVGIGLVLANNDLLGLIQPAAVFGHGRTEMSWTETLRLAGVHTGFLLASTIASVVAWKASEVQLMHDDLTGLPNRRLLSQHLERLLAVSSVTVLYVDLCGFKKVNDVYGHDAGDLLLVEVASRLATMLGPTRSLRASAAMSS